MTVEQSWSGKVDTSVKEVKVQPPQPLTVQVSAKSAETTIQIVRAPEKTG